MYCTCSRQNIALVTRVNIWCILPVCVSSVQLFHLYHIWPFKSALPYSTVLNNFLPVLTNFTNQDRFVCHHKIGSKSPKNWSNELPTISQIFVNNLVVHATSQLVWFFFLIWWFQYQYIGSSLFRMVIYTQSSMMRTIIEVIADVFDGFMQAKVSLESTSVNGEWAWKTVIRRN